MEVSLLFTVIHCEVSGKSGLLNKKLAEWCDPQRNAIWRSIIASKLGVHTMRIPGRKTTFGEISRAEAKAFLDANHLQGGTQVARWCYGLKYGGDLVGVIAFAKHEKKYINLSRMAFSVGVTVVGGAQKLFRNALAVLPCADIVTFSHNQYSGGSIYGTLGFTKDCDIQPSYQWYFRSEVWNKRRLRHSKLPAVLGERYNPEWTEHQNMYAAGARCLYDAGISGGSTDRWLHSSRRPEGRLHSGFANTESTCALLVIARSLLRVP